MADIFFTLTFGIWAWLFTIDVKPGSCDPIGEPRYIEIHNSFGGVETRMAGVPAWTQSKAHCTEHWAMFGLCIVSGIILLFAATLLATLYYGTCKKGRSGSSRGHRNDREMAKQQQYQMQQQGGYYDG